MLGRLFNKISGAGLILLLIGTVLWASPAGHNDLLQDRQEL